MKYLTTLGFVVFLAIPAVANDPAPVFHKDDVILFQGDSITDDGRQRTGNDYNHTMGQDYGYIISAQLGALYIGLHPRTYRYQPIRPQDRHARLMERLEALS